MYLLAVAGLIACKDASLFEAFSGPWTPSSTFYKLLEIERPPLPPGRLHADTLDGRGIFDHGLAVTDR